MPNCYYLKAFLRAQFCQVFSGILNTAPEPKFNLARAVLPAIRGDVTFDYVVFRHRIDGSEMLHASACLPGRSSAWSDPRVRASERGASLSGGQRQRIAIRRAPRSQHEKDRFASSGARTDCSR